MKKKKAAINPKNNDDVKYLQYAETVVLNYGDIESHLERNNRKGINDPQMIGKRMKKITQQLL